MGARCAPERGAAHGHAGRALQGARQLSCGAEGARSAAREMGAARTQYREQRRHHGRRWPVGHDHGAGQLRPAFRRCAHRPGGFLRHRHGDHGHFRVHAAPEGGERRGGRGRDAGGAAGGFRHQVRGPGIREQAGAERDTARRAALAARETGDARRWLLRHAAVERRHAVHEVRAQLRARGERRADHAQPGLHRHAGREDGLRRAVQDGFTTATTTACARGASR